VRELIWIGSTRQDIQALPKDVRRTFGVALWAAQTGETPPIAKVLKGFGGAGVLELIEDDEGGTYRAVYAVRYATAIYVLHRATPKKDIDLIDKRLKRAAELHAQMVKESGR
jgi:phage-related protein